MNRKESHRPESFPGCRPGGKVNAAQAAQSVPAIVALDGEPVERPALFAGFPEIMTAKDVARALQVPEDSVWAMCRQKQIPCVKIGSRYRIPRDLLAAFMLGQLEA